MPSKSPKSVQGMVAVSKDSDVTPLGFISWFSVPDEDVSLRKLKRLWQLAGLDPAPLPDDPKAADAFRRAVRDEEGRVELDGSVIETDVREVLNGAQEIIYQVTRVVRNEEERIVEYPKALRVMFRKVDGDLTMKALGDVPRKDVLPIMDSIQNRYEANAKTITGAKVRTLVRNYLKDDDDEQSGSRGLSGENMRGKAGGVYFVLARFGEQLEMMSEFLSELYSQDRAYLYTVPMADGASERALIRARHVSNCLHDMDTAIREAADIIREGRERSVRENVVRHHYTRLERFRRRAAMYAESLQDERDDLDMKLSALNAQVRKLTGV